MKKSFIIILLLLLTTAYLAVAYFKPAYNEIGGINAKSKPVNLWKSPTTKSSVVAKLGVNEFAKLSAAKTKWNNFYKVNHNQAILKVDFELGHSRVFKQFVLKSEALKRYEEAILKFGPWVIAGLSALFFVLLVSSFFRFISRRKSIKNPVLQNNMVSDEYFSEEDFNKKVEEKVARELENKRNKLIRELEKVAEKEIKLLEQKENTDFSSREKAYEALKRKYDEAVEKGRIMGVDLEGSNIDGLVKGRLFELFTARIWDEDRKKHKKKGAMIEDWTSDKGILEGFYVKSNGNPDFLLSFEGKKVAVECKYRGKAYYLNGAGELCLPLAENTVIARYYRYKKEEEINVFLLFGLGGTAKEPESLYLINIGQCYDTNIRFVYKRGNRKNFGAKLSDIEKYKVTKDDLVERVKVGGCAL